MNLDPCLPLSVNDENDSAPPDAATSPPETSDLIRLLSTHRFRHPTDLACPIFQSLVFTFTGQGSLVIPVRDVDGSAIARSDLWARMSKGVEVRYPKATLPKCMIDFVMRFIR